MPVSIRAAICQHIIRRSPLPFKDSQDKDTYIDSKIPHCAACEFAMNHELQRTKQLWERASKHEASTLAGKERYAEAVKEYTAARTVLANLELYKEKIKDEASEVTKPEIKISRVCFDEQQDHRPEFLVRDQGEFDRKSERYRPGRYADETGDGHLDTSRASGIAKWESKWDR